MASEKEQAIVIQHLLAASIHTLQQPRQAGNRHHADCRIGHTRHQGSGRNDLEVDLPPILAGWYQVAFRPGCCQSANSYRAATGSV
ncbi:MAG: hypothetical protein R2857_10200 [Vampirovibrionales bacterium]